MRISPWKASISSPIRSSWPTIHLAFGIPSTANPLRFSTFSCSFSKFPKRASTAATFRVLGTPARDRSIDFGKYKGKMLGSLPSTYLKWVSKNLRAGDMEEWAKMADEVLNDPVYRDRIEWEAAEKILNGDTASHCSNGNGRNAVTELLEISERFGWDNEDKSRWSKIDFGLLGTSQGGRIPRVAADQSNNVDAGILKKKRKEKNEVEEEDGGGRRRERRERVRQLMVSGIRGEEGGSSSVAKRSPFPGREALLKKVLNLQR